MNSETTTGDIMPREITEIIEALIANAQSLRRNGSVDKKALNKVIARLEEAWLWSQQIIKTEVLLDQESLDEYVDKFNSAGSLCTCPAGVRDSACPVHGANS